jgi:phage terminase large subunit GpA-like protein
MPGYFRFAVAPYLKEIVDCFSVDSPVREVAIQKGVQVCATVGILENVIGYCLAHVKTAPVMMVTADSELAKLRLDSNITPMIQQSGLEHLIKSSDETNTRKTGKALEVSTLIPTPHGFRAIGELHPGDEVYGLDGSIVRINCESDIHERECFELAFASGETVVASDDHRWVVYTANARRVLTTAQLAKRGVRRGPSFNFRVPVPRAVVGAPVVLPIRPYTLGAWLGDGASSGANIAVGADGIGVLDGIQRDGYEVKRWSTKNCPVYGINIPGEYGNRADSFRGRLRLLGLLGNKHIPAAYLNATEAERFELLRGLMDTDGCSTRGGGCQITQKNLRLADEIWSLVSSLGIKATRRDKIARSQHGTAVPVRVVEFFLQRDRSPFTLAYKSARLKERLARKSFLNTIKSIRSVGVRRVKCIGVDHPDHVFLCGRGYIPTHNTDRQIQWLGGGFLIPFGAQNANKLRSTSIRFMLRDEIDGWPEVVGKDGDPLKLSFDRTAAYEDSRKVLDISTPLLKGSSKIERQFLRGDQRRYYVCCLKCGFPQVLRWRHVNPETGVISGIVWDTDEESGRLILGSTRYLCQSCQHPHTNEDKTRLLAPENGAEWRATAIPVSPHVRSYHIPALLSPVGMQSWDACVLKWMEAWDVQRNEVKDPVQLQVFYNNVLGETFEVIGDKVRFVHVAPHRRAVYRYGEVPNRWAIEFAGSFILFVVCTVDVHKSNLAVAVWGFCRGGRVFLLNYWRYLGNCEDPVDPLTWGRLSTLLETQEYVSDDGKHYRIELALIDSGYLADHVYQFCAAYDAGVYPVKGVPYGRARAAKHVTKSETPFGTIAFAVTVDLYKDRWSAALRKRWDKGDPQPEPFFNAPADATDEQLGELTIERRLPVKHPRTGEVVGATWHRPSGGANELWDLLVYATAAHDILANAACRDLGHEQVDETALNDFYEACERQQLYFYE